MNQPVPRRDIPRSTTCRGACGSGPSIADRFQDIFLRLGAFGLVKAAASLTLTKLILGTRLFPHQAARDGIFAERMLHHGYLLEPLRVIWEFNPWTFGTRVFDARCLARTLDHEFLLHSLTAEDGPDRRFGPPVLTSAVEGEAEPNRHKHAGGMPHLDFEARPRPSCRCGRSPAPNASRVEDSSRRRVCRVRHRHHRDDPHVATPRRPPLW
jgi:hypothetical protein